MLRFLVVVSGGFSIGQLWLGWNSAIRRTPEFALKSLGWRGDLQVGGSLSFTYPNEDERCLLVRTAVDECVAFSQKCTHLARAVVPEPEHNRFHCPCHAGYFDIRSGRPIAGPPRRPLPQIELEVVGDQIFAVGIKPAQT